MSENAPPPEPAHEPEPAGRPRSAGRAGRNAAVVLLLLVATVLALLTPPVVWTRNQLLNTDRYVATLTPLGTDPGVQAGVIKAVDQQIDAHLDLSGLIAEVFPARAAQLAKPIESAVQGFANSIVTKFVQSSAFQTLWVTINRLAHAQIVAILTGKGPASQLVSVHNGVLQLDLSQVVTQVKQRLVDAGLVVAKNIPVVGATIDIAEVKGLENAQHAARLLNSAANWLPWLALLFFAAAIAAARSRRRRLITSAICVAAAMVVLRLGIAGGKEIYLNNLPGLYFTRDTSAGIYDTVLRFLVDGVRIIFLLALLVILIAMLFGPSRAAVRVRSALRAGPGGLGGRLPNSAFSRAMARWAQPISWTILGLAALILLLRGELDLAFVLTLAVVTAVLVLAVQAFARAGSAPAITPRG